VARVSPRGRRLVGEGGEQPAHRAGTAPAVRPGERSVELAHVEESEDLRALEHALDVVDPECRGGVDHRARDSGAGQGVVDREVAWVEGAGRVDPNALTAARHGDLDRARALRA
jgi:hypothetical protein